MIRDIFRGGRTTGTAGTPPPPPPGVPAPPTIYTPPIVAGGAPPPPPSGGQGPTILSPGGTRVPTQGLPVQPVAGTPVDKLGRPFVVRVFQVVRNQAPPGYVVCNIPGAGLVGVLRGQAIRAGLYKARPKPPISARDAKAIRRAATAQDRVKKLAGDVGLQMTRKKGKARFGGRRRKK